MFKKYYYIFRYMFIRTLEFRAEVVVYSFIDIMPFFVLFFLWSAVYAGTSEIKGYSFEDIIHYYILVIFIERLTAVHFEGWRAEEIRMGKIDYYLTRPFSYMSEILSKDVGSKIVSIMISIPILLLFYIFIINIFDISAINIQPENIVSFIALMFFAYGFQYMIALWIVLLTFWFEGSSGLEHFKWIFLVLFSGAMIPYAFMPEWLQTAFDFLPLKYISYVPLQVLQNNIMLNYKDIAIITATTVVMFAVSLSLWKKAKFKYASAGG